MNGALLWESYTKQLPELDEMRRVWSADDFINSKESNQLESLISYGEFPASYATTRRNQRSAPAQVLQLYFSSVDDDVLFFIILNKIFSLLLSKSVKSLEKVSKLKQLSNIDDRAELCHNKFVALARWW